MKLIKMLFSKIFISFLILLLQVLVFAAAIVIFEQSIFAFQVINTVFGVLIILGIINKKESPEFKLTWLVVVLIVPLFGLLIYCLFANSKMSLKQYKLAIEISARCKKYSELTKAENDAINEFLGDKADIETYLRATAYSRGHLDNEVKYFPVGEAFYADLLAELEKAEKFIFMEYFIIDFGKMWSKILGILTKKAAAGVEVRLLYDDIGCAGLLPGGYYKKLRKAGINSYKFNRFMPVVSGIHNNRDHRKITVIDGKVAYTGGVNVADEYINEKKRFGHWKDTAIRVRGSAVGNFTAMFLHTFDVNSKVKSDYGKYLDLEYEKFEGGGYIHPFGDGPKPFYPEQIGENNYINMLNSAKKYAYITTPYLIPDYTLISALRNAAMRGVDVRIITPAVPDKKIVFNITRSNYKYLLQAGVRIYEYTPGFIHAKGMITDGNAAFVGTINLDYRSLVHHYECGAVLYKAPCIADIIKDFDETLAVSREITEENFKMNFIASLANAVLSLFSPML